MIVVKKGFIVIAMFAQSSFSLPVNHNILDHLFDWKVLLYQLFAYFGRRYIKKDIQDGFGKGFDSIKKNSMILIDSFRPRRTNKPHETPNYGPVNYKL